MSRKKFRNKCGSKSRLNRLRPLAGLLATGMTVPAFAGPSQLYPTYVTGPQPNGSWVVSDGAIITPSGTQVGLGNQVRAKAIALNPNATSHTAAVLTLGAAEAVEIFDTRSGQVLQSYLTQGLDPSGSYSGITYSPDGKYLMFSQDSSNVTLARVSPRGIADRRRASQRAAE